MAITLPLTGEKRIFFATSDQRRFAEGAVASDASAKRR
jgi:hypothetical protein